MVMLSRSEIIDLYKSKKLRIENSEFDDWCDREYSWQSPFQPCSIDLHVGELFVPQVQPEERGGGINPIRDEHILAPGHTIMIRTRENVALPRDIGGLCFSPSRLALKAILTTNMGHVDPGYSGHLHFTAINMGSEPYTLRTDDPICTMLLFRLTAEAPEYGPERFEEYRGRQVPYVLAHFLPKLSRDFLAVEDRAEKVARRKFRNIKFWQFTFPLIIVALLAILPAYYVWFSKPWSDQIENLSSKVNQIAESAELGDRLAKVEGQLQQIIMTRKPETAPAVEPKDEQNQD